MSEIQRGKIIKGIGGFYYVDVGKEAPLETRARGIFRKEGLVPLVGDYVEISLDTHGNGGFVEKILPRKNRLIRPPVANVDKLAVVVATANPKPNFYILDKMLAAAEFAGIEPVLCLNKTDLDTGDALEQIYRTTGYPVLRLSAATGGNIDQLADILQGNTTAFAGNSGVGKSSLLNCLLKDAVFATGEVNDRIERGRHTTRYSALVPLPSGGYVIDTPGFSTFTLSEVTAQKTAGLFAEFRPYLSSCRFSNCLHTKEKDCGVLAAVQQGKITKERHQSYLRLLAEVQAGEKW